jgi:outer membrane receptor protein involved in Fe transport
MLLHGQGYNYGLNLLIEKRKGRLTGWLSYSWGRAMRRFSDERLQDWYPASHERPHELNAVATYRLDKHWSFGGTYVFASGTPFTAPRKFYLFNSNLVSVFGEHNAQRLKPYMRLDASVNYDFREHKGRRSGINVSFYNLTMYSNDIHYRLKIYNDRFAAKPFRFLLKVMPSVNYYYHF